MYTQHKEGCVVSGIGLATPLGCNHEEFWSNAMQSNKVSSNKKLFPDCKDSQLISQVEDSRLLHGLDRRQLRKLDRFSILSIAAARQCIENAKLTINESNCDRTGILIGNCYGGWGYIEEQIRALYEGDMDAINSYISTAWFPTAPQGEISILFSIQGYSKTLSSGEISAGIAFEHAKDILNKNSLDYIITGGVEAPLTPLIYNSCIENRMISHGITALCEGAALLMLEKKHTAITRGAKIYADFLGFGSGESLYESMKMCLDDANKNASHIDVVLLNNSPFSEQNTFELDQLNILFSQHKPHVGSIRDLYGNAIAANMALDVAVACSILEKQCLPPSTIKFAAHYIKEGFLINKKATSIKNIMINGINSDGDCVTLIIGKT